MGATQRAKEIRKILTVAAVLIVVGVVFVDGIPQCDESEAVSSSRQFVQLLVCSSLLL